MYNAFHVKKFGTRKFRWGETFFLYSSASYHNLLSDVNVGMAGGYHFHSNFQALMDEVERQRPHWRLLHYKSSLCCRSVHGIHSKGGRMKKDGWWWFGQSKDLDRTLNQCRNHWINSMVIQDFVYDLSHVTLCYNFSNPFQQQQIGNWILKF